MKPSITSSIILLIATGPMAHAEPRTYVIAIGNNSPPPVVDRAGDDTLRTLRYADDDAAAFFAFTRDFSRRATLLTVLDKDSQRRFPELTSVSHAPTLVELRRVIAEYRELLEQDTRAGHEPILLFFYSGHGSRPAAQAPSLTLLDGPLTQDVLYDEILAKLPARYVHLLVDACYAEAVVRPRDGDVPAGEVHADVVDVSPRDQQKYAARTTLARFPHVGALIATASAAQAHEWDAYERGVFSHELLSGLRGAADVNGDGRIEYSEIYAFLSAANRGVADPRAHLDVVAHPPLLNRRAAIVDLSAAQNSARLIGEASRLGWFHVEDERGNRLADVFAEAGFNISLSLPANTAMFISNRDGEAAIRLGAGARTALSRISIRARTTAKRGAMDIALQHGLFTAPFGPVYYRGFVDQNQELVPVPGNVQAELVDINDTHAAPAITPLYKKWWLWTAVGVAAAGIGIGVGLGAHSNSSPTGVPGVTFGGQH